MTLTDRRSLAVHEGGHSVLAELSGVPCLGAAIEGLTTAGGKVLVVSSADARTDTKVALAGLLACLRAWPARKAQWVRDAGFRDGSVAAGSDLERVLLLTRGDRRLMDECAREVSAMFADERVWSMVESVANELDREGALNRRALRSAMGR